MMMTIMTRDRPQIIANRIRENILELEREREREREREKERNGYSNYLLRTRLGLQKRG